MEKISTEVAKLDSGSEIVPYVVPKAVEEDHEQEKVQLHDKLFNSLKRLVVVSSISFRISSLNFEVCPILIHTMTR